jgi:hypothetical protein
MFYGLFLQVFTNICYPSPGHSNRSGLNMDLTCISLMIHGVEHFFTYLLAISTSSFEKCLYGYFAIFIIELFELQIFDVYLLWYVWFKNIFSICKLLLQSVHCFFCYVEAFKFDAIILCLLLFPVLLDLNTRNVSFTNVIELLFIFF